MGIKISALPSVTDSSNLTLPANQSGVTSKVGTSGANSLAYKDGTGKITVDQLPAAVIGGLTYKGAWNATTNSPPLGNGGAGGTKGDYYVVSVAGATSIDGISDWEIGDWIVHNGTIWEKIDNTDRSIYGTANQVTVTPGPGSGVTLSTPQDIATISSPTFDNLTLTNDLTVKRIAAGSNAVFGTDGDGYTRQWDFSETISDFSASFFWSPLISNITLDPLVNLTGGNSKDVYSHAFQTYIKPGNIRDFNFLVNDLSFFGHSGSGSIDTAIGSLAQGVNLSNGSINNLASLFAYSVNNSTGSVSNLYGIVLSSKNTGIGTVNANCGVAVLPPEGIFSNLNYGIYIDNQEVAPDSWSIYSNGGDSYFKDRVGIGVTKPNASLEIGGNSPDVFLSYPSLSQPFTDYAPANVWGHIHFNSGSLGGAVIEAYSGDEAVALIIKANIGASSPGGPVSIFDFAKTDGGTGKTAISSDEIGLSVQNNGSSLLELNGDNVKLFGRFHGSQVSVASANDLTLPIGSNQVEITGTTTINRIDPTGWFAGDRVTLLFQSAGCQVTDNVATGGGFNTIRVTSSVNYLSSAGSLLDLYFDGTTWKANPGYAP